MSKPIAPRITKIKASIVRMVAVTVAVLAAVAITAAIASADSIAGSKHDFSTSDGYSDRPCVFCHTPHHANTDVVGPLWNRFVDTSTVFTVYSSSTMDTTPAPPNFSVSMLCLGCHDGTLGTATVNGITGSTKHDLVNAPGPGGIPDTTSYPNCRWCHPTLYGDPPALWQGTDLGDDHPISMVYPTAAQDPEFNLPPDLTAGWPSIPLYDGRLECPTCHKVHDPAIIPFLRISNQGSQLCLNCHVK